MKSVIVKSRQDLALTYINTILLIIILMLSAFPLIFVISASFSDPLLVLEGKVWFFPKGFNLDAYRRVFQNSDLLIGYKNTIIYTVVGTAINLAMTIAGAYPLSRKDFCGRNVIMAYCTFTMFFNGGLVPTYLLYRQLGLYNNLWVMVIPGAVGMWNLIIMRTFFQTSIPQELYEASFIDGCTNIMVLIKVVLPLSKPIIAVTILFYSVGHWNAFFNALIYLSDRNRYPLQIILREILIQEQTSEMMDLDVESIAEQKFLAEGLKYAVIIFASLPVLLLYPAIQKYFVKGVMIGAIKG